MVGCVLVLSAAGCGRFGFEPAPSAVAADDAGEAGAIDLGAAQDAGWGSIEDGGLPSSGNGAQEDAAVKDPELVSDAGLPGMTDAAALVTSPDGGGDGGLAAGTWQQRALPYAAGAAASAVLSDGLHYLGGSSDWFGPTRYRHHDVYNPATDMWSSAPADVPDDDTWGARAHVYENRVYLLGGYPGGRRLRVYAPSNNAWSSLQAPPVAFQWGFASGIIGGALYAFGGVPGKATAAPGYKYDIVANAWTSVAPIPQNHGRGTLSSEVVGNRLYVLNGNQDDGSTLLQIYDSTTNTWSRGADLTGHLYEAAASAVLGSRIYFLGGAQNQDLSDSSPTTPVLLSTTVNIYDTVTDSWSTGPAMGTPTMWATAELYNGQLHVLGGLDSASTEILNHSALTP